MGGNEVRPGVIKMGLNKVVLKEMTAQKTIRFGMLIFNLGICLEVRGYYIGGLCTQADLIWFIVCHRKDCSNTFDE